MCAIVLWPNAFELTRNEVSSRLSFLFSSLCLSFSTTIHPPWCSTTTGRNHHKTTTLHATTMTLHVVVTLHTTETMTYVVGSGDDDIRGKGEACSSIFICNLPQWLQVSIVVKFHFSFSLEWLQTRFNFHNIMNSRFISGCGESMS